MIWAITKIPGLLKRSPSRPPSTLPAIAPIATRTSTGATPTALR